MAGVVVFAVWVMGGSCSGGRLKKKERGVMWRGTGLMLPKRLNTEGLNVYLYRDG